MTRRLPASGTGLQPAAANLVVRSVFIGREAELDALRQELSLAADGEGRVVLLVGAEGIGKTSLALEIAHIARARGATALWAQCHESGGAPAYWPWIQLLRSYVRQADPAMLREDLGDGAAAVGCILPALRARDGDRPRPAEADLTRFHVVDGVAQFLKRAAARRPLVLAIDDMHRADGDSLHLFRYLATETTETSLLLVAVFRGGSSSDPLDAELARVASQPRTTVLRLENFGVEEVRRYVEAATTVRPSRALAGRIHERTDGNPLFVAEVTRLIAADGCLASASVDTELRWTIPATRRHAISARLARVSEDCRRILAFAAVVGQSFTCDVVAAAADVPPADAQAALDEAFGAELIAPGDGEAGSQYFDHALVRQVLYESLSAESRTQAHARMADVLVARIGAAAGTIVAADLPLAGLAHHTLEAATDPMTFGRAVRWRIAAGDCAAAMMAHEDAARHYEIALQVAERAFGTTPRHIRKILVKLVEARQRAGDMRAAREAGRHVVAVAKETSDPEEIAVAALAFAGTLPGFGAVLSDAEVITELEHALALLPSTATALRARVMARLSEELTYALGRGAERALGQQAIELARSVGDPYVLAAVLRTTQWSVWTPDAIERRRHLATEIIALAERTGDRVLGLDGQLLRLWSALEHGDIDVAWRQLDLCRRLAGPLRLPHYDWVTAVVESGLHIAMGSLDEAERLTLYARDAQERTDDATIVLFTEAQRVYVRFIRGHLDAIDELRQIAVKCSLVSGVLECSLILSYARAGQRERARTELAALAADDFARVPRTPGWLMNMAVLANACAIVGDVHVARQLYRHLAPFTPYNVVLPPLLVLAPVAHYAGRLAVVLGNEAAARRHFEDALALEYRTGSRQYRAFTQIIYGQLLQRSRDPDDLARGAELIASGRSIAAELHLEPMRPKADAPAAGVRAGCRRAVFRARGTQWEIEYQGRSATVPHRLGMTYLRCLLERPAVPISAIELASLGGEGMLVDRQSRQSMVDGRAMAQVHRRLGEIDGDIAACRRDGVTVSADLVHERAECARYVDSRSVELVSAADRARSGVTKAIGRALRAIARAHESFGHHLDRHVETGRQCMYLPDPAAPLTFEL